ncbi:hypothetical protein SAMN05192565_104109 [Methylobacterium gossipiicola]|uniref:Uncharacterized protein n=1 Tax=Methylobacterium gossipiicola TaxID=582675 RepID=A0A1I2S8X3_9HYPH|nr:hypothetical protein SAMN05192565_104109 [Methylobacterium gossipiicola]
MSYSIFVRKVGFSRREAPQILACEIESEGEACRIVRNLARSFGDFGVDPCRSVYWFRSRGNLHEIWSAPVD